MLWVWTFCVNLKFWFLDFWKKRQKFSSSWNPWSSRLFKSSWRICMEFCWRRSAVEQIPSGGSVAWMHVAYWGEFLFNHPVGEMTLSTRLAKLGCCSNFKNWSRAALISLFVFCLIFFYFSLFIRCLITVFLGKEFCFVFAWIYMPMLI